MSMKIGGLGKGLDAIFKENSLGNSEYDVSVVRILDVEPNKEQPRKAFDEKSLTELADSIMTNGILQPLLVRPIEDGRYQIVAGERRWRAGRMAGLAEVPVIIKDIDDQEATEIALIENLQRDDLSPVEEAKGYKTLMDKYDLTQEEAAKALGKSRPAVANALRLLNLPQKILDMVESDKISAGHARALLALKDEQKMENLAEEIYNKGLSVRQVESIIKKAENVIGKESHKSSSNFHSFYKEVELSLKENLGRRVKVTSNKENNGFLQVEFFGEDDLMAIVKLLSS